MAALDIIILAIAGIALITGAMRGLVRQVGTIAGLIAAVLACRIFGSDVAAFMGAASSDHSTFITACAYALVFVVVFVGIGLVARLLQSVLTALSLGVVNRIGGALFCMALWLLFLSLAINIYLAVCPEDEAMFHISGKPWRYIVLELAPKLLGYLAN